MRLTAFCAVILTAILAAGCGLPLNSKLEPVNYDLGPIPKREGAPRLPQALLVYDVSAPAWMETPLINYRLAYQDAARPHFYSVSRWVMPPAGLLTGRLRQQFAATSRAGILHPADGVRANYALRVELDEFIQVFDAPDRSRGVVRVRASLLGSRSLVAQRSFTIEQPAPSADADGGVRALIAASDNAIEQIIDWTAQHMK